MSTTHANLLVQKVPILLNPPKRTRSKSLPSALHIGLSSTLSVLLLGVINIAVSLSLGPRNLWSKLVQSGTMMSMVTVAVLAMPNLGNSVAKGIQRIAGVMIGGWLFYALYASCPRWWFLALCLAVWAFILVALSFLVVGNQYLSPVALITAFIVATAFDSVDQALIMTTVKTVAICGSIVLYTLVSMVTFPLTATQQVLSALSDALADLQQLAQLLLIGTQMTSGTAETVEAAPALAAQQASLPQLSKDISTITTSQSAEGKDPDVELPLHSASAGRKSLSGHLPRKTKAVAESRPALLACSIAHNLQVAQQLLPASKRERYVGSIGSYRCFFPSIRDSSFDHACCLAVILSANQVLTTLLLFMADHGSVPFTQRSPPPQLLDPATWELLVPLAHQAVAGFEALSLALPASGPTTTMVATDSIAEYGQTLSRLIAGTLQGSHFAQSSCSPSSEDLQRTQAGIGQGAASRWQHAAALAADYEQPTQPHGAEQIAAAFSSLLADAVTSEEVQTTRWCCTLVLARQLGTSLAGLMNSLNQLLLVIPGKQQQSSATVAEVPIGHAAEAEV